MHDSSHNNMARFVAKYLDGNKPCRVLDIGSQEVPGEENGSYRPLFQKPLWHYEGADIVSGNNVSIVLDRPYRWTGIKTGTYDCVVCGQMFEHDEYFWLTMLEIARILKTGGLCCIVAPSGGPEHRYPVDCYRFYPDGLRAVARYAGLEVLDAYAQWNETLYPDMDRNWRDCVMICRKPAEGLSARCRRWMRYGLVQCGSRGVNNIRYGNDYDQSGATWEAPRPARNCSLYIDTGSGFNEQQAKHRQVRSGQPFSERFELPPRALCALTPWRAAAV